MQKGQAMSDGRVRERIEEAERMVGYLREALAQPRSHEALAALKLDLSRELSYLERAKERLRRREKLRGYGLPLKGR